MEARAKAGLGGGPATTQPPAPAGGKKVVVACAPAPPGSDVEVYDPKARPRAAVLPSPADLATIIRQEIAAALKK
jgi:hypothetical protein